MDAKAPRSTPVLLASLLLAVIIGVFVAAYTGISQKEREAPLWFYILKEAELQQGGVRLAAVGGRIVAEVFLGLLKLDDNSYLSNDPSFSPAPPIAREDGQFLTGDLLEFAGVRLE